MVFVISEITEKNIYEDLLAVKIDVKSVKNIFELLAWDLSLDQIIEIQKRYQISWGSSKILILYIKVLKRGNEDFMKERVLNFLWNIIHIHDVPACVMGYAIDTHTKILDNSKNLNLRYYWLEKCARNLKTDNYDWFLFSMNRIRSICQLLPDIRYQSTEYFLNNQHQSGFFVTNLIIEDLFSCTNEIRKQAMNPNEIRKQSKQSICYTCNVETRLNLLFLVFQKTDIWLSTSKAIMIWEHFIDKAIFEKEKELIFVWFTRIIQLMTSKPLYEDLEFMFNNCVLKYDASLMDIYSWNCFKQFFNLVNIYKQNLSIVTYHNPNISTSIIITENLNLLGLNYLWSVIVKSNDNISWKAILFLKNLYTDIGFKLMMSQNNLMADLTKSCIIKLRKSMTYTNKTEKYNLITKISNVLRILPVSNIIEKHEIIMFEKYATSNLSEDIGVIIENWIELHNTEEKTQFQKLQDNYKMIYDSEIECSVCMVTKNGSEFCALDKCSHQICKSCIGTGKVKECAVCRTCWDTSFQVIQDNKLFHMNVFMKATK